MSDSTQTPSNQDIWAATTDLTTLRQKLLDLFCQLAYQEGDFVLSDLIVLSLPFGCFYKHTDDFE